MNPEVNMALQVPHELIWALLAVIYVVQVIVLFTMARRRYLKGAWTAFLPVGNLWLLGSLADHYQYVVHRKICRKRMLLPVLGGVLVLAVVLQGLLPKTGTGYALVSTIADLTMLAFILVKAWTLYSVYDSCDPGISVAYTMWSALACFLVPVFLLLCFRKDYGMPPLPPMERKDDDTQCAVNF